MLHQKTTERIVLQLSLMIFHAVMGIMANGPEKNGCRNCLGSFLSEDEMTFAIVVGAVVATILIYKNIGYSIYYGNPRGEKRKHKRIRVYSEKVRMLPDWTGSEYQDIKSSNGDDKKEQTIEDESVMPQEKGDEQSLLGEQIEDQTSVSISTGDRAHALEHNEQFYRGSTKVHRPSPTQQTICHLETQTELTNLCDQLMPKLNETTPQQYKGQIEQGCNTKNLLINEQTPSKKVDAEALKNNFERDIEPMIAKQTTAIIENSDSILTSTRQTQEIDIDAWRMCIYQTDFALRATNLLKEGKIPDRQILNTICSTYSRKTNIVQTICRHICSYIKRLSNAVVDVWPAYRYTKGILTQGNENNIVFVLIKKEPTNIPTDFDTYQRRVNEISLDCKMENNDIKNRERKSSLPENKMDELTACLRKNARHFMKNHSNLTRVSLSWIKAIGYGARASRLKESLCITLYVHIKGFIPINEDPFVEDIQNYDIDVREGVFELCGTANDLHQNVKMGCAIDSGYGTKQGTVGPFVKYELDSHMYFITSAHVVLEPKQMQTLINTNCVLYGEFGPDTFQPPESESVIHNLRNPLGKTELTVYREGDETDEAGVEIALVRIKEERIPLDGAFPDTATIHSREFVADNPFNFSTGEVCEKANLINSATVYKFGCSSGLTKGFCRINGASSVRTNTLRGSNLGFNITLHGQIEIDSVDDIPFGEEGDSGSIVLTKQGDIFVAVGIFEGKMNDTYLVTPIHDIQEVLSILLSRDRHQPQQHELEMDIEELYSPMAIKLQYTASSHRTVEDPENSIGAAEGTRTASGVETHILNYTDHKINSVKAELTAIKVHIDATKNELVQQINQMEERLTQTVTQNIDQQIESLKEFLSNR